MRIYLTSVGCKLNQSEVETLARRLASMGHQVVARPEEADLCILNTCAVTHIAARKSRQLLRRLRRANPSARLVATGCYAEIAPGELAADMVVGNADKERLVELLGIGPIASPPRPPTLRHTRAFIKVQDGCNNACAYCIIRIARGRERSVPLEQVLAEVRSRVEEGYKEVVLTGVNLGAYGRDLGLSLHSLVEAILSHTRVPRLRLSSIEPWDLDDDFLRLWTDPRLCRHLHLPLQSGCDETLRRMGRRYTTSEFAGLVERACARIPGLAITTDIIVGFPGETEEEFARTVTFVEGLGLARLHVFPFSPRPGTKAATMPNQVASRVKKARVRIMLEVARRVEGAFRARFLGHTMEVLWERRRPAKDGRLLWSGLTDNYLRVFAESERDLANVITRARLVALMEDGLEGQVLDLGSEVSGAIVREGKRTRKACTSSKQRGETR